jgi:hypothetical protein
MEIENFKMWHWMLAGLVAGALYSCVIAYRGPAFDTQSIDTIDVGEFEQQAYAGTDFGGIQGPMTGRINQYHKDLPLLKKVVVHPPLSSDPDHHYWVTGMYYTVGERAKDPKKIGSPSELIEQWKAFKYAAATPYVPGYALREKQTDGKKLTGMAAYRLRQLEPLKKAMGGVENFPTVVAYLHAVAALPKSRFTYSYAWYELPAAVWSLPPVSGLLIIGIAWPLTLALMQSWGLARPPAVVTPKKPRQTSEPLSRPIKSTGTPATVVIAPPVPEAKPVERVEYGGEFYPVIKAHKQEDAAEPAKKS